jgi:citrate lyase beta subunit
MKELKAISNLLFTPGNRPERFAHAKEAGSDGIVIDLEDAIALSDKAQ